MGINCKICPIILSSELSQKRLLAWAMEAILSSSATISAKPPITPHRKVPALIASFPTKTTPHNSFPTLTFSSSCYASSVSTSPTSSTASFANYYNNNNNKQRHWMVVVDKPPLELSSKPQIIDYYVKTLERVFGRWVWFWIPQNLIFVPIESWNSILKSNLGNRSSSSLVSYLSKMDFTWQFFHFLEWMFVIYAYGYSSWFDYKSFC